MRKKESQQEQAIRNLGEKSQRWARGTYCFRNPDKFPYHLECNYLSNLIKSDNRFMPIMTSNFFTRVLNFQMKLGCSKLLIPNRKANCRDLVLSTSIEAQKMLLARIRHERQEEKNTLPFIKTLSKSPEITSQKRRFYKNVVGSLEAVLLQRKAHIEYMEEELDEDGGSLK